MPSTFHGAGGSACSPLRLSIQIIDAKNIVANAIVNTIVFLRTEFFWLVGCVNAKPSRELMALLIVCFPQSLNINLRSNPSRMSSSKCELCEPRLLTTLPTVVAFWLEAGFCGKRAASYYICLLYTSPSPRDATLSRMPSSA